LTMVEILNAAHERKIKGMLIMGENPALSDPNTHHAREALARLEFLAVEDIYLTETAEFADVVLPAASFFEKTGTYTNTDRRVQVGRPVLDPPGEARPDWQVLCDLATRLGHAMHYHSPQAIFAEFTALTKNYRGLTYDRLGSIGRIWPCPESGGEEDYTGQAVLFAERFPTPTGRARFVPSTFSPAKELPDDEYPLLLNTGRLLEHYLTGTMTRRSAALDALEPTPFIEVHPDDLSSYGISDKATVTVRSRRGSVQVAVRANPAVSRGSLFLPIHFREAAVNLLTIDALDPTAKIPEFKVCAVRIEC